MAGEGTGWGGEFHLDNATGVLTEILEVTEVGFPEDTVDEIEVTTLKAPGRRKMFIPGLIDGGSFTVKMNYTGNSAADVLCLAAKNDGVTRSWEIHIPNALGVIHRKFAGDGYVSGYALDALTPGSAKTATLTVRVTGAVTEGAAT